MNWVTPVKFVDAARQVLGPLDMVLSSTSALRAKMGQPWAGRVFVTAVGTPENAVAKFVTAFQSMEMSEGILLTSNETDTRWFAQAAIACQALCFTRGRIRFLRALGNEPPVEQKSPVRGAAFFYFGTEVDRFKKVFERAAYLAKKAPNGKAVVFTVATATMHVSPSYKKFTDA